MIELNAMDRGIENDSPFEVKTFAGKTCDYPVAHITTIESLDDLQSLATFLRKWAVAIFPDIPESALEGFTLEKIGEDGIKRVGSVIVMDPSKWPKGRDEDFATFEKEMTKAFNDKDVARRDELKEAAPDQWDKFIAKRTKQAEKAKAEAAFIG